MNSRARHTPRRVSASSAFTLAEVMAALFVLTLAFGSAFSVMQRAAVHHDTARSIAIAGEILQAELEKERIFTWTQAADANYQPAVDAGFTRAFVTIADSQLTTLACALVMFWLGAGPIRGFAVTLTVGICTSIFAAVTVVRLLIYYWLNSMKGVRGPIVLPV